MCVATLCRTSSTSLRRRGWPPCRQQRVSGGDRLGGKVSGRVRKRLEQWRVRGIPVLALVVLVRLADLIRFPDNQDKDHSGNEHSNRCTRNEADRISFLALANNARLGRERCQAGDELTQGVQEENSRQGSSSNMEAARSYREPTAAGTLRDTRSSAKIKG